jgi:hypothetical protein
MKCCAIATTIPYWFQGQRNPAFKKPTDGRLLDFKDDEGEGQANGVTDFKELLDQLDLPKGTVLVVVPGHDAAQSNDGRPLARAANTIAESSVVGTSPRQTR